MNETIVRALAFVGFAALAVIAAIALRHLFDGLLRLVLSTPRWQRVMLAVFVAAFVAYGGSKTNQVDQTSGTNIVEIVDGGTNDVDQVNGEGEGEQLNLLTCSAGQSEQGSNFRCSRRPSAISLRSITPLTFTSAPPPVTPEDIARGWQLVEVRTNCNMSYTMPEGATLATNWWLRGAYEDVRPFDFGGWRFPFGTNEYSSLWAFSWGKVRFALADTNEIVAVGAPMSAVPYRSRLWTAADTNGARLVTWENFALNRDTNTPGNAQIELRSTGDFIVRSNEVESVCRRVDPDDYDDDGWQNDDDSDPYCWDESWDDFWQELPEGANTNAYCWIDIRPRWNSYIEFVGDGPSDLADPYLYGMAGKTYRVLLLIGKTYEVECSQPVDVVGRSDVRIEVTDVGPDSFTVVWPVVFEVGPGRASESRPLIGATWNDGGASFHVLPDPNSLGGEIVWYENCCSVRGDGINFTYTCDNSCTCEGCTAYGGYRYGGYELPVVGWPCGCSRVDDNGPFETVDFGFDKPAAIYEDPYTNMPGVVVYPTPSNVVLRCEVYGGTYGGRLTIALNEAGLQKLGRVRGNPLPNNVQIPAGTSRTFETEYTPLAPSEHVGDIVATMTFVEDFLNETHTATAAVTSVKVELTAEYEAPENNNPSRHVYGVGEQVNFKVLPQNSAIKLKTDKLDTGDDDFRYELFEGMGEVDASSTRAYVCPISASYRPPIRVAFGNATYWPVITLAEPNVVVTPEADWEGCHPFGTVGQSTLVTTNYIGPMSVSFQGIMVAEIPCDDVIAPIGYFASEIFASFGHLSHTTSAGAGRSRHVQAGNRWTMDESGGGSYPSWEPGRLEWKIPIGWGRLSSDVQDFGLVECVEYERRYDSDSRPLLIGNRTDKYKQVMTIGEDGTSKVEKFGHWLSRGRYCRIILDGVTKQWTRFH